MFQELNIILNEKKSRKEKRVVYSSLLYLRFRAQIIFTLTCQKSPLNYLRNFMTKCNLLQKRFYYD